MVTLDSYSLPSKSYITDLRRPNITRAVKIKDGTKTLFRSLLYGFTVIVSYVPYDRRC